MNRGILDLPHPGGILGGAQGYGGVLSAPPVRTAQATPSRPQPSDVDRAFQMLDQWGDMAAEGATPEDARRFLEVELWEQMARETGRPVAPETRQEVLDFVDRAMRGE